MIVIIKSNSAYFYMEYFAVKNWVMLLEEIRGKRIGKKLKKRFNIEI